MPVCERELSALELASQQAAHCGDVVELRLDCLIDFAEAELQEVTAKIDRPVIVTLRPREQGGHIDTDKSARQHFWKNQARLPERVLFDIEVELAQDGTSIADTDWQRVICSHHDFDGVPASLNQIYEAMSRTPARILKIAVAANDVTDCIPLFQLIERARTEGRDVIAVAMGSAGVATRILGPSRGNYLTYGSLGTERGTAPGQLTADQLRKLYRVDRITRDTQVLGLIGLPVGHSISPQVHNTAFAAAGVDAVYIPFEVRDLQAFIKRMAHPQTRELDWNLSGLSITAPHKTAVLDYIEWIDPAAAEIGAVNTIVVRADGLHGYNTDAMSVLLPVQEKLGSLRDSRWALIGTGGVAKAVLWSLRNAGAVATVLARDERKGDELAAKFGARCRGLEGASFSEFDVVVNATPLGTHGISDSESPASAAQLRGARLAYDLVYNPSETVFMRQAREAGLDTIGGRPMFVLQAAEQFKLWTGLAAPAEVMSAAADRALG